MGNNKKYYLGLDIGTSSVGFAVTDENYNLVRKQGKHLWGSRLFDEAKDASARRQARSSRRRLARRRERLNILQSLFNDDIKKVDEYFFERLNHSSWQKEDYDYEKIGGDLLKGHLSNSAYYKKYPTIYHLRNRLLTDESKADIREIYLAIAHIIKYRGNFLKEGDVKNVSKSTDSIKECFEKINDCLKEIDCFQDLSFDVDDNKCGKLLKLFKEPLSKGELLDNEKSILNLNDKTLENFLGLVNGGNRTYKTMFRDLVEEIPDLKEEKAISFDIDDFDEKILSSGLPDEYINLLMSLKRLYDIRVLVNILKESETLSSAMVTVYENHKTQLRELKELYKYFCSDDKYVAMFKATTKKLTKAEKDANKGCGCSYSEYIGRIFDENRKRKDLNKAFTSADLYKRIKAELPIEKYCDPNSVDFSEQNDIDKEILKKLKNVYELNEKGEFLKIQNSKMNGVIPYQLNKNELIKIIENQGKYYPFLLDKGTSFISPTKQEYKIVSLLEYKIPYYVGPLKTGVSKNAWSIRKEDGKILPWNFYEKIDAHATAEQFIRRMKNKCQYLKGEETLPKFSLLNLQFQIYNELNNIQICVNGTPLNPENQWKEFDKVKLFNNIYKNINNKKITAKKIEEYLKKESSGVSKNIKIKPRSSDDEEKISDILKTSYTPYIDFVSHQIFPENFDEDLELFEKAERVIELITLFEDKSILKEKLSEFGFNEAQLKYLCSLNYKDWSRFSKKFLTNISNDTESNNEVDILSNPTNDGLDKTKSERETIFNLVKYTPKNFMSVYYADEYGFVDVVNKYNESIKNSDISDLIENSYLSPMMKRSVRQTFKIIDELERILKIDEFDRIFVECTREHKDSKRKNSRNEQLQAMFNAAKTLVKDENEYLKASEDELKELNKTLDDYNKNGKLKAKKYFLYFAQLGHDVYSGEHIKIEELDKYDVDHIIPQAMLKDDSFTNTVLVKKQTNNDAKSDTYPFAQDSSILKENGRQWIRYLNKLSIKSKTGYMTNEKMSRILRTKELTNDELEGFINRQITTTNQSVKAVIDILKTTSKKTEVIYSKAGLVSDFRNLFGLVKVRFINNLHHAYDAYLNIVVGNVYYEKFNNLKTRDYIIEQKEKNPNFKCFTDVKSVFCFNRYVESRSHNYDGTIVWYRTYENNASEKEIHKVYKELDISKVGGTIDLVKKTLSWHDPMVTHMLRTQTGKQGFFNKITIKRPQCNRIEGDKNSASYPLSNKYPFNKENWDEFYGGYSDLVTLYFYLVESDSKDGKIYTIESISSIFASSNPTKEQIENEIAKNNGYKLKNPRLVFESDKKVLINSVLKLPKKQKGNGPLIAIASKDDENRIKFFNNTELFVSNKTQKYLKIISNIFGLNLPAGKKNDNSEKAIEEACENEKELNAEMNIRTYQEISKRMELSIYNELPEMKLNMLISNETFEIFKGLNIMNQCKVLISMVQTLFCSSGGGIVSFAELGSSYPKNAKRCRKSKVLEKGTKIVEQSYTGFYEKVLFEVK